MIDQSQTAQPLHWNYYSEHGLFRREEYYFGLLSLICAAMVIYCKTDLYSFGLGRILVIGETLSNVYPGMRTIIDGAYDAKTKEFYSLFYLLVPAYFCVGLFSGLFISPYRYRVLIVGVSNIKMAFFMATYSLLALLPICAPMIGFNSPSLLTLFNTVMMAGIVFMAGKMLVAGVIKYSSRGIH